MAAATLCLRSSLGRLFVKGHAQLGRALEDVKEFAKGEIQEQGGHGRRMGERNKSEAVPVQPACAHR